MKVVTKNTIAQKEFSNFSSGVQHDSSTLVHNLQLTNFIKLYFDFLYYLGACPVRFTRYHGTTCFTATKWLPQKVSLKAFVLQLIFKAFMVFSSIIILIFRYIVVWPTSWEF